MSPLPSGYIAPAQLVKDLFGDNYSSLGGDSVILTPYVPTIDNVGNEIFISAIGAMTKQEFYVNNSVLPRAPAVDIDLPPRDAGDLLLLHIMSAGTNQGDSNGNWDVSFAGPFDITGASNFHGLFWKRAAGDSTDQFSWPETNGNQFDANRCRMAQMITVKSRTGTPTFLEHIGGSASSDVTKFDIINRTIPVGAGSSDLLTIASYSGDTISTAGSQSSDLPYGVPGLPLGTEAIGDNGMYLFTTHHQYRIWGWSHFYQKNSNFSTSVTALLEHHPDDIESTFNRDRWKSESFWAAFYASP